MKVIAAGLTSLAWRPVRGPVAALAVANIEGRALDEGRVRPCWSWAGSGS